LSVCQNSAALRTTRTISSGLSLFASLKSFTALIKLDSPLDVLVAAH